jgi:Protein of unknown function (DUF2911)
MQNYSLSKNILFTVFTAIVGVNLLFAQGKDEVRISPKAKVEQIVGFTTVTIDYSRPGVKGREIWGGLVPYNTVWRAGANEATKITFSSDVIVNGKKLKAGSYGFFTIPTKDKWTLIFNRVADQWGAFEYNEEEDVLRIQVTPETKPGFWQEWLAYTITKTSDKSAIVRLEWEKLKVPFTVEVSIE